MGVSMCMKDNAKKLFCLAVVIMGGLFCGNQIYKQWQSFTNSSVELENEQEEGELVYTAQEKKEILKWKHRSMEDLQQDAERGDKAALHNLGSYFLYGIDFPIDVQIANHLFAQSASLGFGPALDQLTKMYIFDESNAFLSMVYMNLTIACGHTEFTVKYHELRNNGLRDFGPLMMQEIERLACQKMAVIWQNQQDLAKAIDQKKWFLSMKNIVDEDVQYSQEYWKQFYVKKNTPIKNEPWYLHIDSSSDLNADQKEFLKMVVDCSFKVPEITANEISENDIKKYLENTVPALIVTQEGRQEIINSLKQLSSIPIMKADAMEDIISEYNGVPPYDLKVLVDKRTGSKVKTIIQAFQLGIKY